MSSACSTLSRPCGVISKPPLSRSTRVLISNGCRVPSHSSSSSLAARKRRNDLYSRACTGHSAMAARKASTVEWLKVSCSRRGEYWLGARGKHLSSCGSGTTRSLTGTKLVMAILLGGEGGGVDDVMSIKIENIDIFKMCQ